MLNALHALRQTKKYYVAKIDPTKELAKLQVYHQA
jgi:hypothetical protein